MDARCSAAEAKVCLLAIFLSPAKSVNQKLNSSGSTNSLVSEMPVTRQLDRNLRMRLANAARKQMFLGDHPYIWGLRECEFLGDARQLVGTRRFSASDQFWTTIICGAGL